jgi:hypothetical protein
VVGEVPRPAVILQEAAASPVSGRREEAAVGGASTAERGKGARLAALAVSSR